MSELEHGPILEWRKFTREQVWAISQAAEAHEHLAHITQGGDGEVTLLDLTHIKVSADARGDVILRVFAPTTSATR